LTQVLLLLLLLLLPCHPILGTPWTSTGGFQVKNAPHMSGAPDSNERYRHL
jgi:hypothetical protein